MAPSIQHRASVGVPHACERRPSSQRCPTQISAAAAICCTNPELHAAQASRLAIRGSHQPDTQKARMPMSGLLKLLSGRSTALASYIYTSRDGRGLLTRSPSLIKSPRLPGPLAPCPPLLALHSAKRIRTPSPSVFAIAHSRRPTLSTPVAGHRSIPRPVALIIAPQEQRRAERPAPSQVQSRTSRCPLPACPSVSRSCSLLSFCDCALYVRPRSTVRHRGCISPTSSTGRRRL